MGLSGQIPWPHGAHYPRPRRAAGAGRLGSGGDEEGALTTRVASWGVHTRSWPSGEDGAVGRRGHWQVGQRGGEMGREH